MAQLKQQNALLQQQQKQRQANVQAQPHSQAPPSSLTQPLEPELKKPRHGEAQMFVQAEAEAHDTQRQHTRGSIGKVMGMGASTQTSQSQVQDIGGTDISSSAPVPTTSASTGTSSTSNADTTMASLTYTHTHTPTPATHVLAALHSLMSDVQNIILQATAAAAAAGTGAGDSHRFGIEDMGSYPASAPEYGSSSNSTGFSDRSRSSPGYMSVDIHRDRSAGYRNIDTPDTVMSSKSNPLPLYLPHTQLLTPIVIPLPWLLSSYTSAISTAVSGEVPCLQPLVKAVVAVVSALIQQQSYFSHASDVPSSSSSSLSLCVCAVGTCVGIIADVVAIAAHWPTSSSQSQLHVSVTKAAARTEAGVTVDLSNKFAAAAAAVAESSASGHERTYIGPASAATSGAWASLRLPCLPFPNPPAGDGDRGEDTAATTASMAIKNAWTAITGSTHTDRDTKDMCSGSDLTAIRRIAVALLCDLCYFLEGEARAGTGGAQQRSGAGVGTPGAPGERSRLPPQSLSHSSLYAGGEGDENREELGPESGIGTASPSRESPFFGAGSVFSASLGGGGGVLYRERKTQGGMDTGRAKDKDKDKDRGRGRGHISALVCSMTYLITVCAKKEEGKGGIGDREGEGGGEDEKEVEENTLMDLLPLLKSPFSSSFSPVPSLPLPPLLFLLTSPRTPTRARCLLLTILTPLLQQKAAFACLVASERARGADSCLHVLCGWLMGQGESGWGGGDAEKERDKERDKDRYGQTGAEGWEADRQASLGAAGRRAGEWRRESGDRALRKAKLQLRVVMLLLSMMHAHGKAFADVMVGPAGSGSIDASDTCGTFAGTGVGAGSGHSSTASFQTCGYDAGGNRNKGKGRSTAGGAVNRDYMDTGMGTDAAEDVDNAYSNCNSNSDRRSSSNSSAVQIIVDCWSTAVRSFDTLPPLLVPHSIAHIRAQVTSLLTLLLNSLAKSIGVRAWTARMGGLLEPMIAVLNRWGWGTHLHMYHPVLSMSEYEVEALYGDGDCDGDEDGDCM